MGTTEGKPTKDDLHELSPSDGREMYLNHREAELRESTINTIQSRVGLFVGWRDENGIGSLHELDGMDLHQFRLHTSQGVTKMTLACRLTDLRTFLRWARSVEAVDSELPEKVIVPETDRARTVYLDDETAISILDYMERFEHASRDHVVLLLLWKTGARLGAIRGLDVGDFHTDGDYLEFHRRPETDTPLKNGVGGERPVSVTVETSLVVSDD